MPEQRKSSVANTYEAASGSFDSAPLSFWSHYGRKTIERLDLPSGAKALDVACGTGSSAIPAAEAVGEHGSVIGVDIAGGMLAAARKKAEAASLSNTRFVKADMTELDFPDHSFDTVICVFGIFFARDMESLVIDLWRMVKPGGQLAITSWGNGRFEPLASAFEDAVRTVRPELAAASSPWRRIGTEELLGDLLIRCGVGNVQVSSSTYDVNIDSPDDWWTIIMGSGSRWGIDRMMPDEVNTVRRSLEDFITRNNVTSVPTSAIYGTGLRALA